MQKIIWKYAVFFVIIGLFGGLAAGAARAQKMPVDPKITVGTFKNGLTYYIRENREPENRAELRLVVKAGSILEDEDQLGMAHFVEHMAFNGTKNFAKHEIVDYLERIGTRFGADLNASTSFDETIYKLRVPTDSLEILQKAFQILEDWAHNVTFDPDEIEKERGVVVEEWRGGRGAGARMRDKQFPVLLERSHYAERLPIGTPESIESATPESIKRFYRDWYRPDLMAVIAVGDFKKQPILQLIKKHFAGLPEPAHPRARVYSEVPDHAETLVAIATDPEATRTTVSVYYKHPPDDENTHEAYRLGIVSALFNAMLNDRFNEIVQQAGAPFLAAFSVKSPLVRTKTAYVLSALVRENSIERGLEALLKEAERVARFGFTRSELDRHKKDLLRAMQKLYQERENMNSASFASEFIRAFTTGEGIPGIEYEYELHQKYMPEITIEEVNRLASQWITARNRVLLVNAPEKEGVVVPSEAELLAVFNRVKGLEISAYEDNAVTAPLLDTPPAPSRVVREKRLEPLGLTEWHLENGVRVLLKPTDFKEDEVLFRAYSPGGTSLAADEDFVAASTSTSVVMGGGVGEIDRIQLQKVLAGKIVRVRPYIDSLEEGLSGGASPKDLETMFQLIFLRFTAARKDSGAFRAFQSRLKGFLQNRSASPEAAFSDTLQVTLAQHHPRALPISPAYFDQMDLQKSFAFYQDRFADASDFTFVFVGAFDVEKLRPLVETYLGGLPSLRRRESWRDTGIRPPKGVISKIVNRGTEPKSKTQIVFTGPFVFDQQHRYALQSLVRVLRIRLREALREDRGGTYGVGVWASPSHFPEASYSITISFGCDPLRLDELVFAAFEEIHQLQENGPTADGLAKVQEMQRRERELAMKQNGSWLSWIEFYDRHGEDMLQIERYPQLVDGLTAATIRQAAKQYFNLKNYVQVSLLPESN